MKKISHLFQFPAFLLFLLFCAPSFARAATNCDMSKVAKLDDIGLAWTGLVAKMVEVDNWVPTGSGANGKPLAYQPGIAQHRGFNSHAKSEANLIAELRSVPCEVSLEKLRQAFQFYAEAFNGFVNGRAAGKVNGRYSAATPPYLKFASTHMNMHTDCRDALNARGMVASKLVSDYPYQGQVGRFFELAGTGNLMAAWSGTFGKTVKHKVEPDCDVYGPGMNSIWFSLHAMVILDMLGRTAYPGQWSQTGVVKAATAAARQLGDKVGNLQITLDTTGEACKY